MTDRLYKSSEKMCAPIFLQIYMPEVRVYIPEVRVLQIKDTETDQPGKLERTFELLSKVQADLLVRLWYDIWRVFCVVR